MTQYGFYFNSARCTGCKTCELACKDYKDLSPTIAFRKVYDYEGGAWISDEAGSYMSDVYAYHVSLACNHCDMPACLGVCPTGALSKDAETGIVRIDEEICIGDGACVEACPYNVPIVDTQKGRGVKCDLCYDRVTNDHDPICVEACPLRALDFGEIEELRSRHGELAAIAPMPPSDQTKPNIVITTCPAAKEPGDTTGSVMNEGEVTGVSAS